MHRDSTVARRTMRRVRQTAGRHRHASSSSTAAQMTFRRGTERRQRAADRPPNDALRRLSGRPIGRIDHTADRGTVDQRRASRCGAPGEPARTSVAAIRKSAHARDRPPNVDHTGRNSPRQASDRRSWGGHRAGRLVIHVCRRPRHAHCRQVYNKF